MADKDGRGRRKSSDEIWVTEFTTEAAIEFREQISEHANHNPHKPIVVYVDSYGGAVDALASMIATMDEAPNPIITCCIGKAMSCGAILLSHGDVRFIDPHARVMVHKVSSITSGDTDDITNDAAEISRLNKYWLGFMADNCDIEGGYDGLQEMLRSKDGRDRYMDAKASVEFGIADVVGRPQIAAVTMYEVVNGSEKTTLEERSIMRSEFKESLTPIKKQRKAKPVKKKAK